MSDIKYFIDDVDMNTVVQALEGYPLHPDDADTYQWLSSENARYRQASRENPVCMSIGILVSKEQWDAYRGMVARYPHTRNYQQWADALMAQTLTE